MLAKAYKIVLRLTDLLDAERIPGSEDDLLILKALKVSVGTFNHRFDCYFHSLILSITAIISLHNYEYSPIANTILTFFFVVLRMSLVWYLRSTYYLFP